MDTVVQCCDLEGLSVIAEDFGRKVPKNSSGFFKNIGKESKVVGKENGKTLYDLHPEGGNVKFGNNEVITFDINEGTRGSEKNDLFKEKTSAAPRSILKINAQADWVRSQRPSTQEMAFEIFCRCCILCNISVDELDENDPSKSLKAFFKDIEKAFAAKDKFHKCIRREEKKELSKRWQNSKKMLEANQDEITRLGSAIASINNENSLLRSENSKLQISKKQLTDELRSAYTKLKELENIQTQNVELLKQNGKSKDKYEEFAKGMDTNDRNSTLRTENLALQATKDQLADELTNSLKKLNNIKVQNMELIKRDSTINDQFKELTKTNGLLEEQNRNICQLNKELNAAVQKMISERRRLEDDSKLQILSKDMNDKLFKAHTKLHSVESENFKLTNDLEELKSAFQKNLEELLDENLALRGQAKMWQTDFKQLQGKYNAMNFEQKEIIEEREKFLNDSRRYFEKTLKLQFELDEHKKFKEKATKLNVEKNECQRKLKKLEYDYCTLQKSSRQLFLQNQTFLENQMDSARLIEDMGSKITHLETARETNVFKIDSLTRQILGQTKEIGQNNGNKKLNLLTSLANARNLMNDPVSFNRNVC